MKQKIKYLSAFLLGLGLTVGAASIVSQQVAKMTVQTLEVEKIEVKNNQPSFGAGFNLNRCATNSNGTSTGANLTYLARGASTTLTCTIDGADLIDLNLMVHATASPITIGMTKEFSFNGIDFYGERQRTALSGNLTRTVAASTTIDVWSLAQVGTTTLNIGIEPLAARWVRVEIGVGGGATGLYAEVIRRSLINR